MSLKLITPPAAEPVTLIEAKAHLRVSISDDDTLIGMLIKAAREACEHELGRALITQTWELALDVFPEGFRLPYPSVQSVASVKYVDPDGTLQTLADTEYALDNHSEPAYLVPAYGKAWPATRAEPNAVRVQYLAGFGDAGTDVPEVLRQWILLQAAHWYGSREAASATRLEKTPYVDSLLDRYRVYLFA
jgi:uncharacterized phiE125 gp8 family phage protein